MESYKVQLLECHIFLLGHKNLDVYGATINSRDEKYVIICTPFFNLNYAKFLPLRHISIDDTMRAEALNFGACV